jgi:hypothetical protein
MTDASAWTTRVDPAHTRHFGVEELHNAYFAPPGWPGKGATVGLLVPECETQFCFESATGEPFGMINRPPTDKRVKYWTRFICDVAAKYKALLIVSCDTPEQVATAARRVAKYLPKYRRIAPERMADPRTRALGALS